MSVDGKFIYEQVPEVISSFFKKHLFQPVLTPKGNYTLNNECGNNISSIVKIIYHCKRFLANKQHSFSHFSSVNFQIYGKVSTLNNMSSKFSGEHPCSSEMTFCLRGPNHVNTVAKLALSKFGYIPIHSDMGRDKPVG